jgi:hypothetical protein
VPVGPQSYNPGFPHIRESSDEDPEALADALVAQLEAEYTPERLRALKINQGYASQGE